MWYDSTRGFASVIHIQAHTLTKRLKNVSISGGGERNFKK